MKLTTKKFKIISFKQIPIHLDQLLYKVLPREYKNYHHQYLL